MLNPTEYKASIKTENSFILCFSESFHPLWRAYVNGKEYQPILAYSMMNAFFIDQIGDLEITIIFLGQRYVNIGGIISLGTIVVVMVTYLFYESILREALPSIDRFKVFFKRLHTHYN